MYKIGYLIWPRKLDRGNSIKETRQRLCLKGRQARLGIISIGTNKDQLLHRIQSLWTFTNLQYNDGNLILVLKITKKIMLSFMLCQDYRIFRNKDENHFTDLDKLILVKFINDGWVLGSS